MDDVRWFAPNRFGGLPVPALRRSGLRVATEGEEPARLAFAMGGSMVAGAFAWAWRHRAPLVTYLWDLPPWQLAGGSPNPVLAWRGRLLKLPHFGRPYPERNGYFSRVRYAASHALEVWTGSTWSQAEIARLFGLRSERVPFCFDSDRFNRHIGRATGATSSVLSVSRLVAYKNQAAVLRAVSLLTSRPTVRFIGSGPEAQGLRALAADLGVPLELEERWHDDDEIVYAYRQASVVVCPSRFEGLGVTPLEAAALGVPTVASDIPAHREFSGASVALVQLDDDRAMADAIAAALAFGPAPREPMHPFPELTIEACAGRFLGRFEALLKRR